MVKRRIAVLGGGMASLTALFELTSLPGWKNDYAITVYQQGWRLGGKGASGRNLELGGRIEEHGLHLFFGWYENVFRILRAAYEELTGDAAAWQKGVLKLTGAVTMQEKVDGRWLAWPIACPHDDGAPGDGTEPDVRPWKLAQKAIAWASAQVPHGPLRIAAEAADLLTEASFGLGGDHLRSLLHEAHRALERADANAFPEELRRARILASIALAMARGVLADLVARGSTDWFSLDDRDLREWLGAHGASAEVLASAPVSALYDAVFSAYSTVGAGTIVQALLRAAFTWRGSAIWRLDGGMGDVLFAPLYRVLAKRGVDFRFFHRVEGLELSEDRRNVERVRIDRQVPVRDTYDPLVILGGEEHLWPSEPLVEQLDVDPAKLAGHDLEDWWDTWRGKPVTLARGDDFDDVLLGISVGALSELCEELVHDPANPRFGDMVRGVLTTQTRAVQLWMNRTPGEMRWGGGACTIPFEEPYDTACEMNHLIRHEPGSVGPVKMIAYLCSPMDDDEPPAPRWDVTYPARQLDRARADAHAWLEKSAPVLWPGASTAAGLDWSVLVDPQERPGDGRLDAQFVEAPDHPSDRYVLIAQNSHRFRLRADESGYDNLTLTGDWIKTALSGGFLESAAMGGIQAARAIDPRVPRAIGDWLPASTGTRGSTMATATPFIARDGDLVAKPPLDLDVDVYVFLLRADEEALTRVLDEHLGRGRDTYRPLGPFVGLYLSSVGITAAPFAKVPTRDFGIWLPAVAGKTVGASFLPDRVVTYTPYLWADNGWAMIGGREVFGFPKQLGTTMTMPGDPSEPAAFALETMVLPVVQSTAEIRELFRVHRTDAPTAGAPLREFQSGADLARALAEWATPLSTTAALLSDLSAMTMVFLKQLPDPSGTTNACYRALVEAPVELRDPRISGGPLAGTYDVQLRRYASHDIARRLGLRIASTEPGLDHLTPLAQLRVAARARLQPGTTR